MVCNACTWSNPDFATTGSFHSLKTICKSQNSLDTNYFACRAQTQIAHLGIAFPLLKEHCLTNACEKEKLAFALKP